ncbi:MAG TPA: iron ABC transporter permease [Rhodospirillaceae bacterium]|nr:iron ABC transporter permease [Rhodospirillaceae bacterium]|tara:strand:- start:98 stop:1138 length:1041 start_codon:yes stop_codon:yes gene_type:complete
MTGGETAAVWTRRALGYGLGLGAVAMLFFAAATVGRYPVSMIDVARILWEGMTGLPRDLGDSARAVVLDIRVPRLTAALLVGVALSAAGATYQSVFRNPLVAPDILGVTSGAGLGAVLAIFLSLPVAAIQAMAFVFGLGAVTLVYSVARAVRGAHDPILVLVLAGVVIGAVMGAGIAVLTYLADPYDQLPAITFWLMGSLAGVTFADLATAWPAVALGLVPLLFLRWRVNLMSLGDDEARALGVDTERLRLVLVVCATLATSAVVAIAGTIGWVGLIIPHMARFLVGPEFSRLLPATILLGAIYLLGVDTLARAATTVEIPLGVLNAFVGAPLFLWVLARARLSWR